MATVRGGGGGGTGSDGAGAAEGSGGGFGLVAHPTGVFVIRDGEVSWRPALDLNRVVLGGQLVAIVALLTIRSVVKRWERSRKWAVARSQRPS